MAQGRMNGVPNEIQTHSCRFASQMVSELMNKYYIMIYLQGDWKITTFLKLLKFISQQQFLQVIKL